MCRGLYPGISKIIVGNIIESIKIMNPILLFKRKKYFEKTDNKATIKDANIIIPGMRGIFGHSTANIIL